jgi:probable HAF family extracellular repeat protein
MVGRILVALFLLAITAGFGSAHAADYTYETLDHPDATNTWAHGINDAGQVVGSYRDGSGKYHGYLYSGGSYTVLDCGHGATSANGINNLGQVVGGYTEGTRSWGFLYTPGEGCRFIFHPDDWNTAASGINDAGQIVGTYFDGETHGFLLSGGAFTALNYPQAWHTYASGINNAGLIVGHYYHGTQGTHGFVYSGGAYTALPDPAPGAYETWAVGVNNAGQISGWSRTDKSRGFVYSGGAYTILEYPGCWGTLARGINQSGQTVGEYWCSPTHGFLATPASEPLAVPALHPVMSLVLAVILIGLGATRSRQGRIRPPSARSGATSASR